MTKDEAIKCLKTIEVLAFRDVTETYFHEDVNDAILMAITALKAIKTIKIGRWVATENEDMEVVGYYCSRCDLPMETDEKTNYCPNCGARMVEPIGK